MLVSLEDIAGDVRLGLWSFSKAEGLSVRDCERKAVNSLLAAMLNSSSFKIEHTASGKPSVKGYNISISHTHGYVSVIVSSKYRVSVDIEYQSDRVDRIASRFMRTDEVADTTVKRLINWCAKETVYKLFSEENLTYQQMHVIIDSNSYAFVNNLKSNTSVLVYYRITSGYVLTYSFMK